MFVIVSTLSLVDKFKDDPHMDSFEKFISVLVSLLYGLLWPITIWVSAVQWIVSKEIPAWAEVLMNALKSITKFITNKLPE
jgi:hypothetical protein